MSKHLERDIQRLRNHITKLGALVEQATNNAIKVLGTFDLTMVNQIVRDEEAINEMEVEIEEECLKTLALHQPVATDLRFLIVVLKVNNDLERMGDQVLNIAERIEFLADKERIGIDLDFETMGRICVVMLRCALDALVRQDAVAARKVLDMDSELNALHARTYVKLQNEMTSNPKIVESAVSCLTISSNLERLGDLATNIAEEIIFMEEGEIVRHQTGDKKPTYQLALK
jgi:phosphate transport system protein